MTKLKVNFCAAPSSYKSTVCVGVEAMLKQEGIVTDTSKEYVREYINEFGFPQELYEQLLITEKQNARDEETARVSEIMLSDNPAINAFVFGKRMLDLKVESERRKKTPAEYNFLKEIYMKALNKAEWFDIIFVFPPNVVNVDDNTRQESASESQDIYQALVGYLHAQGIPFYFIEGTTQERIQKCYEIIMEAYNKKTS
jgi:nicotinamide riboside kinase